MSAPCPVWGCTVGAHEPGEVAALPLPGQKVYGNTVVASVYDGDAAGGLVLLLAPRAPFYLVARLDLRPHGNLTVLSEHPNIVPAVREYEQEGGDY